MQLSPQGEGFWAGEGRAGEGVSVLVGPSQGDKTCHLPCQSWSYGSKRISPSLAQVLFPVVV